MSLNNSIEIRRTLQEKLTYIILALHLWWVELDVVDTTAGFVNSSARDATNEQGVVDLELEDIVDCLALLLQHLLELSFVCCLFNEESANLIERESLTLVA